MDSELHSVVNIRLPLTGFEFKKKHTKLMRQNERHLRVVVGHARIDQAREDLYSLQKIKFKGFVHESLEEVLYHGMITAVFDTREVAVYDGDELIAVSFFDVGENSIASLLCLYHPGYKKETLGIYTMLHEVQWAVEMGKKWYYPGYILDRPSSFDYKLSLGEVQWFNDNKRWCNWSSYSTEKTKGHLLRTKIEDLKGIFQQAGVKYQSRLYPYFAIGYVNHISEPLLKHPIYLDYEDRESGNYLIATFDLTLNKYITIEVEPSSMMKNLVALRPSRDYLMDEQYQMVLLRVARQGDLWVPSRSELEAVESFSHQ